MNTHIAHLLCVLGRSEAEIAAKLDVSQPTLSRWLNGKTEMSLKHFVRLRDMAAQVGITLRPDDCLAPEVWPIGAPRRKASRRRTRR